MDHCAICYRTLRSTQSSSSSKESLVEQQLSVLFLLDNLLDVTEIKERFTTLLKKEGNPSTWIRFCYPCSIWVEGGKKIYRDIVQLQKDLDDLKDQVESTIKKSYNEKEENDGDKDALCSILRATVVHRSNTNNRNNMRMENEIEGANVSSFSPVNVEVKEEDESMDPLLFDDLMEAGDEDAEAGDDISSNYFISPHDIDQEEDENDKSFSDGDIDPADSDPDYRHGKRKSRKPKVRRSSGSTSTEPKAKASIVRPYYEQLETTYRCKLCGLEVKICSPGHTSNILRHIRKFHSEVVQGKSKTPASDSHGNVSSETKELPSESISAMQDCYVDENRTMSAIIQQPKGPSIVHRYFESGETVSRCTICGQKVAKNSPSGHTSNRLRHLRTVHPDLNIPKQPSSCFQQQGCKKSITTASESQANISSGDGKLPSSSETISDMEECHVAKNVIGQQRSSIIVYQYFEDMQTVFRCKLCGRELRYQGPGQTYNRLRHLRKLHPEVVPKKFKGSASDSQVNISRGSEKPSSSSVTLSAMQDCQEHLATVHKSGDTEQYRQCKKDCEICGKGFTTKETYDSHIQLHLRLVDDPSWGKYCKGEKISLIIQKDKNGGILNMESTTISKTGIFVDDDDTTVVTLQKE